MRRSGFTIVELLVVLGVVGTVLTVLLGSFGNWGTAHAMRGSVDLTVAGLEETRMLARQEQTIACLMYENAVSNQIQSITRFQTRLLFPKQEMTLEEMEEKALLDPQEVTKDQEEWLVYTPEHRLPAKIKMRHAEIQGNRPEPIAPEKEQTYLFFRPDGSVFTPYGQDVGKHDILLLSNEPYTQQNGTRGEPLKRLIRVTLENGSIDEVPLKLGEVAP